MSKKNIFNLSLNVQTVGVLIAAIGVFVTLIMAWFQIAPGKPELEVRILSVEEFSVNPEINGLIGEFTYKGKKIDNLLNVRINITNTGNKTIIGKGSNKNIIGENVTIYVPDNLKIVDSIIRLNDLDAKLTALEETLSIEFSQWRANESIGASIYFNAADIKTEEYFLNKERDIIDGSFNIVDVSKVWGGVNPLVEYIPVEYIKGLKVFGYMTISLLALLCSYFLFELVQVPIAAKRWFRTNGEDFSLFVGENLAFLSDEDKVLVKDNPSFMEEIIWMYYEGEECPASLASDAKGTLIWVVFLIFIMLGFLPLFVSLHYLY